MAPNRSRDDLRSGRARTTTRRLPDVSQTESPAFYLRELQRRCPLDADQEARHAREIQSARRAIRELLLRLPRDCRETIAAGGVHPRPGRRWPLEHLETCCARLSRYRPEGGDPVLSALLRRIDDHKRRLDRSRDALVLANLRFVPRVAKRFANCGLSFMDLVQEGHLGLLKAVDRFEHERGFRFCTYAFWWIRQSISKALVDKGRLVRLPAQIGAELIRLKRARSELTASLGRMPTTREIAGKMRLPAKRIDALLAMMSDPRPIEDVAPPGRGGLVTGQEAGPASPTPLESALDREVRREIIAALSELSPREEEVIRLRFGVGRDRRHTLSEIGNKFGISRERIRQIERGALDKLPLRHLRGPEGSGLSPARARAIRQWLRHRRLTNARSTAEVGDRPAH
jgi:RNA polymerase sigma factor (sigma-70 family)